MDEPRPSPARGRLLAVAAVSVGVLGHIAFQFSSVFLRSDWSLSAFRGYFVGDQLSYLAIVANAAQGQFEAVEPFTETGSIYYPRAYYLVMGWLAGFFHIPPTAAWALLGLVCQVLLVAAVGVACIVLSGRLWTGVLGGLPFVIGTFSYLINRTWSTELDSHAVLWGPFGVLFPMNAGTAGLCLGATALILLALAYTRITHRRLRVVVAVAASALLGLIANVQTYSFLTASFLAAFLTAAVTIAVMPRRRWLVIASVALVPVVFLIGPVIGESVGQLAALVFGLLPALPALVVAVIRTRGLVAICGLTAVAFAAPTVVSTAIGLRNGDPFLTYRVASSATNDLGVPLPAALLASAVLLLALALVFAAGVVFRSKLWMAAPIGLVLPWFLLTTNDAWGASQEPYRMWIDANTLIAALTVPLVVSVAVRLISRRQSTVRESDAKVTRVQRRVAIGALGFATVVAVASMADFASFYSMGRYVWLIHFDTSRDAAIAEAAQHVDGELLLTDPCIEPTTYKAVTGEPVAFMNRGMAWPTAYAPIDALIESRIQEVFPVDAAREAGVSWVLTDDACVVDWGSEYGDSLEQAATFGYTADGTQSKMVLWRVEDDRE